MDSDGSQFYQIFYEETEEHLAEMETLLLALEDDGLEPENIAALFRATHSIKGGAATFGFKEMAGIAHVCESVLDRVRKGVLDITPEMTDLLFETKDVLGNILIKYKNNEEVDSDFGSEVCEKLQTFLSDTHPAPPDAGENFADPDVHMQADAGESEEDVGFGFFGDDFTQEEQSAPEVQTEDQIVKPDPTTKTVLSSSLRIDVKKIDQLFDQVGEIVITQAMLAQMASELDPVAYEKFHTGLGQLEQNTRSLQESVVNIRMVPCRSVFSRFPRLIREMSHTFNKEVELILVGEETEVDKGFVEMLVDPLTHLFRNSFDHGIESREARLAAGKPEKGRVILKASHQGGSVVIEVRDDGSGLNRDKILKKAKELKLVDGPISDEDIWQLIFAPGFSTTDQVSDLSGRGVGMDVVRKNVQTMGGTIHIESEEGFGCCFMIKLPLTLSIIEGMVLRVGKEVYILPLISIVESIRPLPDALNKVMGRGEAVNLRGDFVPISPLYKIFGVSPDTTDPSQAVLVIVESENGRAAIMVDELLGQQQVVIKSLQDNFVKVPGIGGATILGNGRVAFIIDVREILQVSNQKKWRLVA